MRGAAFPIGVSDAAVNAGTMASSKGNANVTPAPLKNARRGIAILEMNIALSF
jgi:hypothetical protein